MGTKTRFSNLAKLMGKLDPRSFFSRVTGQRQESKSTRKLRYTLEMVFLGIISGCKTRRELETLSSDLGERLPHSTIVEHLVATNPESLRASNVKLIKQVRNEITSLSETQPFL
jgi:hypothetical protein